jgi:hypothetical protein
MGIDHLFHAHVSVIVETQDQANLPGQPHSVLSCPIAGEGMKVERPNGVQILYPVGSEQRAHALHIPPAHILAPGAGRLRTALVPRP